MKIRNIKMDLENMVKCCECGKEISLKKYSFHLRFEHAILLGSRVKPFVCRQDGCQKSFALFKTLNQHLLKEHFGNRSTGPAQHDISKTLSNITHLPSTSKTFETPSSSMSDNNLQSTPALNLNQNTEIPSCSKSDLNLIVGKVACNVLSKSNMTGTCLETVMDGFCTVISAAKDDVVNKFLSLLKSKNFDTADEDLKKLVESLNNTNDFGKLHHVDGQYNFFKDHLNLIEPKEIILGGRLDMALNKLNATFEPIFKSETFQYVPIIDTLKLILSKPCFSEAIEKEKPNSDFLLSFIDGDAFKENVFFQKHPKALRLQLYYDDLEITNPLGSKTSIHKLGAFYVSIQNLPVEQQSYLPNIHLVILCHTVDIQKYDLKSILKPFLEDIKELESETGVVVEINGIETTVRATLASFCADGLAAHEVYGMLQPSAKMFCRMCLISREDLHSGSFEEHEIRTKAMFETHVAMSIENYASSKSTGIKKDSPLNELKYFHTSSNYVFDPMHDFFEGICPYEIKLVLNQLIFVEKLFNVQLLNERISMFDYGFPERKNKPSANLTDASIRNTSEHHLKQRAMQSWCLTRVVCLLIGDKVPEDHQYVQLLLMLLKIMEIVFSPKLTNSILPYLQALISDHNNLFKELFPENKLINKHHHITHYPRCIKMFGPIVHFWCMRYEAKHQMFKKHAQVCCNFKNIPKTMARYHQITQCSNWQGDDPQRNAIETKASKLINIHETELSEHDVAELLEGQEMYITKALTFNGTEYRPGLAIFLRTCSQENVPIFGIIKEIIVIGSSRVLLAVKELETQGFFELYNAYLIKEDKTNTTKPIFVDEIPHKKPFGIWRDFKYNNKYISLRHLLL